MRNGETVAPYDTKCCDTCQCGGGCRFAQAALDHGKAIDTCVHPYQGVYESDSGQVNCHGCGQVLFEPLPEEEEKESE